MRADGLRARLALWYAGIFGAVLIVFALLVYSFVQQALHRSVEDGARLVAKSIAQTVHGPAGHPVIDLPAFDDAAGDADLYQGVAGIEVVDPAGHTLARYGAGLPPTAPGTRGDQSVALGANLIWLHEEAVGPLEAPMAYVRVSRPLSDLQRTLGRFALQLMLLVPVTLLVTVVGGVVMAGQVMKPIGAALDRLRQFTADASHELRTPVTVILAQAEAIAASPPLEPEALSRALEPIQRASRRLAALVGDLLFLARSDAHQLELVPGRLALDELVESAVEEYAPLARAKGLALRYQGTVVEVVGDPQRLHQLVANLLDNAIKYTATGTIRVEVGVAAGQAQLRVSDSGCGIPARELALVFERFYRTDATREAQPGTGLGLSIARAIAEAHQGQIRLASEPGQGTEVTVSLPRLRV